MLRSILGDARFFAHRLTLRMQGVPGFLQNILAIPGELTAAEGTLLFELAKSISEGVVVEIGSNNGRSTVALGLGVQAGFNVPVFAIEPHEHFVGVLGGEFGPQNRGIFYQTMLRTGCYRVVRLINTSSEVVTPGWQRPVSLLWIDGDHRYDAVWRDVRAWLPHLLPNAWIAFHDSIDATLGPRQVINEMLADGSYIHVKTADSITLLQQRH